MDTPIWASVVSHTLTIVKGYTGISFTGSTPPQNGGKTSDGNISIRWVSDEVDVTTGPMKLVSDTVRVELTGTVAPYINDELDIADNFGSDWSNMAYKKYQVQIILVHSRKDGKSFNATRTLTFDGPYFSRFED